MVRLAVFLFTLGALLAVLGRVVPDLLSGVRYADGVAPGGAVRDFFMVVAENVQAYWPAGALPGAAAVALALFSRDRHRASRVLFGATAFLGLLLLAAAVALFLDLYA